MIVSRLFAMMLLLPPTGPDPASSSGPVALGTEASQRLASQTPRVRRHLGVSRASVAVLTTAEVYGITGYSAFTGGEVISDGGAVVTARGVCWSTNSDPTIADSTTADGTGSGSFTSYVPGLLEGTTYTVRAYSTNAVGTAYGSSVTFSTLTPDPRLEYLGQTAPGRQFVRFAPGIVPENMYHSVTVSPDGQEIYWGGLTGGGRTRIMVTRIRDGRWTNPEPVSLGGRPSGEFWDDAPVVSPDNRTLFFTSERQLSLGTVTRWGFWSSQRTATGWSAPAPLPDVVNATGGIHWGLSISSSGTLFFGAHQGASAQIFCSRLVGGEYTPPAPLGVVNVLGNVICPCIAPDESYIIVNKIEAGVSVGYYISFKGSGREWLPPVRAASFPSPSWESSFVTRDGKYVFCKSYWASAAIIEDLRPSGSLSSTESPTNPGP